MNARKATAALLAGLLLLATPGCRASEDRDMTEHTSFMESNLAGQWYSADGARLRRELDGYLRAAPMPSHPAMAAVLPHAGFLYSGPCAAAGARALAAWTGLRRVILLGFTHHVELPGQISLPSRDTAYRSPLGTVPLDRAALDALAAAEPGLFVDIPVTRHGENSVELIVPLLQAALDGRRWTLVPLTLGQLDADDLDAAAHVIAPLLDGHTAVVASSDFTHYGDRFGYTPFRDDIPARLSALDHGAIAPILAHDAAAFDAYCRETSATICGQDPIGLLLRLLPPTATGRELAYDSSGARTGEYDSCVSYAALAFDAPSASKPSGESSPSSESSSSTSLPLAPSDKHTLLTLARTVIDEALHGDALTELDDMSLPLTPALRERRGAFVTLNIDGELRGCIGEILPRRPLVRVVADHALSAAFEDPRFPPLTAAEWPSVRIEISALTPPRPVGSWRDIQIGRHGMTLSLHGRMAVFLPQVAPEQGWDLETTLTYLARKAGLPSDAWRDPACRFTVFEAEVFHE